MHHSPAPSPPADQSGLYVGLDIGGTKTAALIVDQAGQALAQLSRSTLVGDPERLVAEVVATTRAALEQTGRMAEPVLALGIAVPGLVDPDRGLVELAVNLKLSAYPLGSALAAAFNAPVHLENDVRTAAMGAFDYWSSREKVRHLAYLSIGTGIASGVILDGRLYRGAHGMAGEIGHVVVEPGGPVCGCGQRGCLEAVAAGPAISRLARELATAAGLDPAPYSTRKVYQSYDLGDAIAAETIRRVSAYYARAIEMLIMGYDVDRLVLGGGVTAPGEAFLKPILSALAELRAGSPLAETLLTDEKLALMPPGYNAGAWGAASFARQLVETGRSPL